MTTRQTVIKLRTDHPDWTLDKIGQIVDRTRERANYMSYIRNQAQRLEQLKYELKQAGVAKNVDIAEFQQKATVT